MAVDLLTLRGSDLPIRTLVESAGAIFRDQFPGDSGNQLFGVQCDTGRFLVKCSGKPRHIEAFKRVQQLYLRVQHPALPPLRNAFAAGDGYALVFDWLEAEHYGHDAVRARFAALDLAEKLSAYEAVLDLHVALEQAGYVAEDLYDGSLLYDFAARRVYFCDFDEYHVGAFVLERERTLGSTRFTAPEEFVRGATIDERTTVYNLGRLAAVMLGDKAGSPEGFCGTADMAAVVTRATCTDPQDRYACVRDLAAAWREAANLYRK